MQLRIVITMRVKKENRPNLYTKFPKLRVYTACFEKNDYIRGEELLLIMIT